MKLSVFYPHVLDAAEQNGVSVPYVLNKCVQYGVQAVEIDSYHLAPGMPHFSMIKEAGLSVSCVNCFYALDKELDTEKVNADIQSSLKAGADKMLIIPGFLSVEDAESMHIIIHDRDAIFDFMNKNATALQMINNLKTIAHMASPHGIGIVLEDFDHDCSPISGLNGLLWFLQRIPEIGCCFDTGNFITYKEDPISAWTVLKERVVHIHCKDRAQEPVAVGSGTLPLNDLLLRVISDGYSNTFAIEHYGAKDQMKAISDSVSFLKHILPL